MERYSKTLSQIEDLLNRRDSVIGCDENDFGEYRWKLKEIYEEDDQVKASYEDDL